MNKPTIHRMQRVEERHTLEIPAEWLREMLRRHAPSVGALEIEKVLFVVRIVNADLPHGFQDYTVGHDCELTATWHLAVTTEEDIEL